MSKQPTCLRKNSIEIVAYNLIRDVMAFIARHANLDPKET